MYVGLLGPFFGVDSDGAEIRIPARKERAVLAFLALRAGSVVSSAQLEAVLWGDDPPKTSRETLKTYVSHLRRALSGGQIETMPGGYRLAVSPIDVDVTGFETLLQSGIEAIDGRDLRQAAEVTTQALSLWRGEPLPDLADQPIGMAEAARLWDLRRAGQERNFAARLALGEHAELVGDLESAIAAEPLRERLWQQLMLALYRSGRQADALRAYQRLRKILDDELGIEPNREITALEAAILNQDPDVSLSPARITPAPGQPGQLYGGNVTFLFTDVEGSTRLIQRHPSSYAEAIESHRHILRSVLSAFGGMEVDTEGDGLFAVFADAGLAISACLDAQRALIAQGWDDGMELRVRMGLSTGIAHPTEEGDYHAVAVHEAARLCAAAHGGQVLMSADTARLVRHFLPAEAGLVDRGTFMLKGFDEPERIHQLTHPDLPSVFPPLRASPAQSHNLPDLRMSFVGRSADLQAIEHLLERGRLVTLVGPGGAGKTRVAVELGARVAERFEGGVHLCDLSPQGDPTLVPAAMAEALGVREAPDRDALADVAQVLADRDALLILDSCEHLVASVASAVDRLLSGSSNLRVLATSREPLGVAGEHLWRLGPLDVPHVDDGLEAMRQSDAMALFEARAQLRQPAFSVGHTNAVEVADICRQLEGLPLAIELVAAQVASLPPSAIADRLRHRPLSVGAVAHRPGDRHRNLEATVDWSYRLLDEDGQRLLRLLSVFANGFTIEATRAVADSADPLATLTRLVDKSLVVWDADASRYRLLESIRTFARVRLEETGEADAASARHLAWCANLADQLKSRSRTGSYHEAYDLFDRELDNFRAALDWAANHSATDSTRLAGAVQSDSGGPAPPDWWLIAVPDPDYYEQVETDESVEFPLVPVPRRFRLETQQATIGRRSVQRGITPDIDLSAPPADSGISHQHAVLDCRADGTWTITDPGSTNRTYLNDSADPLPFQQPVPIGEHDRIHIGAWTTLTLQRMT